MSTVLRHIGDDENAAIQVMAELVCVLTHTRTISHPQVESIAFGLSDTFQELERELYKFGVVWELDDAGFFTITYGAVSPPPVVTG